MHSLRLHSLPRLRRLRAPPAAAFRAAVAADTRRMAEQYWERLSPYGPLSQTVLLLAAVAPAAGWSGDYLVARHSDCRNSHGGYVGYNSIRNRAVHADRFSL